MKESEDFLADFGKRIKRERLAMGLSQMEVAYLLQMSIGNLHKIETGAQDVRFKTFIKLVHFYRLKLVFVRANSQ